MPKSAICCRVMSSKITLEYLLCISRLQRPGCSLLLGLCGQRPCRTSRPFQRPLVDSSSGGCGHLHSHLPPHLTSCGGGDHEGLLSSAAPELLISTLKCTWIYPVSSVSSICSKLTGSPSVTTPYIVTTLWCLNCPMMAASWRNLTLSSSPDPSLRVFTATSTSPPPSPLPNTPLYTVPNCPDPSKSPSLHSYNNKASKFIELYREARITWLIF